MPDKFIRLLLYLPLVALAVSAHEAAHAWAARWRGDDTAARQGRVTLMPFVHVDLWGTLLLPALMVFLGLPVLGYAKPTPVDPGRLRRPRVDFSVVAAAGPVGNLLVALALALAGALAFRGLGIGNSDARQLVGAGIVVNAVLACLNLLPLPGFDGLKALYVFLPERWCWRLHQADRYFLLVLVLVLAVFTQVLDLALWPAGVLAQAFCTLAGSGWPTL